MSNDAISWFRSRSAREQLLLTLAAFIVLGGGVLLLSYQAVSSYRATAAVDLAGAMQLREDLQNLRELEVSTAGSPAPASDGSVRGVVVATASQYGLMPTRVEPDGPTGIRTAFEPANAQKVYQWVDAVERAGLVVSRIVLVRAGEGDLVEAAATIASSP